MYVSYDKDKKLCFDLGSLIGHGNWLIMDNVPGQEMLCDLTCGAITYAEHNPEERCVTGNVHVQNVYSIYDHKIELKIKRKINNYSRFMMVNEKISFDKEEKEYREYCR